MSTLDKRFTAVQQRSRGAALDLRRHARLGRILRPAEATCASAASTDGHQCRGSVMALGDGTRKLAVPANNRAHVSKDAGDTVSVQLDEPIPPAPRRSTR